MNTDYIEPFDWSRRFFDLGRTRFFDDMFRGFAQMKREMERDFEDIERTNDLWRFNDCWT
jgi:hypothetical protein